MQRLKKLFLLLFLLIFTMAASGCMRNEICLELNNDNTGLFNISTAFDIEAMAQMAGLTAEEAAEINMQNMPTDFTELSEEMKTAFEELGLEDAIVEIFPFEYEIDSKKFIGSTTQISYTDTEEFIEKFGKGSFKIIDLGNGKKRLEMVIDNTINDSSATEEDISGMVSSFREFGSIEDFKDLGIEFTYTLRTNFKVTSHNADSTISGAYDYYKWNVFEQLEKQNQSAVLFIEYEDTSSQRAATPEDVSKDIAEMRLAVDKKIGISLDDKDFHGKMLQKFGILTGSNNGLELDRGLTRVEGAAVYARILGLEEEIKAFNEQYPDYDTGFKDIPGWVKPTINYLHYMGLVNGISNDQYGSAMNMTETQFTTLVLRALGFSDKNGDFNWAASDMKAKEVGLFNYDLLSPDKILGDDFTRQDMTYIAYNALYFRNINTGEALIEKFIKQFDWAPSLNN